MRAARKQSVPSIEVFVENLPGNVYRRVRRPDGRYYFEFLSAGLFRQFDIDNERLLAEEAVRFDWIHPDDKARFVADLEVSAATLALLDHRVRVIGAHGQVHWARGIARPSRRPDGSVVWDGIVIDVTREVEAEAALRVAKEEADRAHGLAAKRVAEAAARIAEPLSALDALVSRMESGAPLPPEALRRCRDRLRAALSEAVAEPERSASGRGEPTTRGKSANLTARQQEVLRLVAGGLSNKAIAQKLGITPGTAKLHVAAVLRALDARSRRELRETG
jgi:DNA-binding NarL/FixJ family response regulator